MSRDRCGGRKLGGGAQERPGPPPLGARALSHRPMLWFFPVGSVPSVGLEPTTVEPRVTRSTEGPKGPLSHRILPWILGWVCSWLPRSSLRGSVQ